MSFTQEEIDYVNSQPLARLATLGKADQPDVVPVMFEFDGHFFFIGGRAPENTRKFRNIRNGRVKVAIVIDDLVSREPVDTTVRPRLWRRRHRRARRTVWCRDLHEDHARNLVELESRTRCHTAQTTTQASECDARSTIRNLLTRRAGMTLAPQTRQIGSLESSIAGRRVRQFRAVHRRGGGPSGCRLSLARRSDALRYR